MSARIEQLVEKLQAGFGRITRWQLLCKEQNATTDEAKIRLAEQVLNEWSTGTVAEWYSHWLRLNGAKTVSAPPYQPTGHDVATHLVSQKSINKGCFSAVIKYKKKQISGFEALVDQPFDLKSPSRSTVPLIAYWSDVDARLVEFGNAINFAIPRDVSLTFEYTVPPRRGKGKASRTDLMILHSSSAISVEAKYTEKGYSAVSKWLGIPPTDNKRLVLEGWLEVINKAVECDLTVDSVQNVTYQLIHRTASACSVCMAGAGHRAVVYLYFDPVDPLREYYCGQLRSFASLVNAPEKISFLLYMTTLSKTREYAQLQADWLRGNPKRDLSVAIRKLLREGNVATFSDPVVLKF
jgi:hypothetical protein